MQESLKKGFSTATDLADALVKEKNIPFREAHHIVGRLVALCVEKKWQFEDVPLSIRSSIASELEDESFYQAAIDIQLSTEKKLSYGSTSLKSQKKQLTQALKSLDQWEKYHWNIPQYNF